jgi:hypothetical protein
MKSEIITNPAPVNSYPNLYSFGDEYGTIVVLMVKTSEGTIVYSSYDKKAHPTNQIGYHSRVWEMNVFRPFSGVIKLSSE